MKFKYSIYGHKNWINAAYFSPDMRLIGTCSEDHSVKIWDAEVKKQSMRFIDHMDAVTDCKFSPDGTCMASCGADGNINIRDIRSGKLIQHYESHEMALNQIDYHPSGYYMVSAGNDLKIWDLRIGRMAYEISAHGGSCTAVKFS